MTRTRLVRAAGATLVASLLLSCAVAASADTFVWVDEQGVTHLTDDPSQVPAEQLDPADPTSLDELRSLWSDGVLGVPVVSKEGASGSSDDRVARLLAGAVADWQRGEVARASATLRNVLRMAPGRPEAHWIMASIEAQRSHYRTASEHLQSFLSTAGPDLERWRLIAERRLAELDDERRLAAMDETRPALELREIESSHFKIELDSELDATRTRYAETVLGMLEAARDQVSQQLGVVPDERLGVVFYGRAAYLRAHRHRFSFQTVGFFDGRIHVSAPAHPGSALRGLLYHEYTHALYRERTGGDRPYWLNEGLAELVERRAKERPTSTRSERISLRTRIAGGDWVPLRRLGPGFEGLSDEDARAAYLQSIIAAEWIEAHTERAERARMLERLGQGMSVDQVLYETVGLDTDGLDAAVRDRIVSEFPRLGERDLERARLDAANAAPAGAQEAREE